MRCWNRSSGVPSPSGGGSGGSSTPGGGRAGGRSSHGSASRPASTRMPKGAFRILVVDDDPLQAKRASVALTSSGFVAPSVVGTAREALALANAHDVVLLDIQLPDGNG